MIRFKSTIVGLAAGALLLAGCSGTPSDDPTVEPTSPDATGAPSATAQPAVGNQDDALCVAAEASRADAAAARDATIEVARGYADHDVPVTFIEGHEVTEIRPIDADKGKAIRSLLVTRSAQTLALCIGDDRTDEDAFRQLPPGAVTVRVGNPEQETAARFRLADPREVREFLIAVVEARR